MKKLWNYAVNTFEVSTQGSYIKANIIADFHYSALVNMQKDPDILQMLKAYTPSYNNFKTNFTDWETQIGMQEGKTVDLNKLLDELASTLICNWDVNIQVKYNNKTGEYKSLLPHKRKPFQAGKQTERIAAVKALSTALAGFADFKTLKLEVDDFYKKITQAYDVQKVNKSSTTVNSKKVEDARLALCTAMYDNMGLLMHKYAATPEKICTFFDLEALRHGKQTKYTGHIKPLTCHTIAKHTFAPDAQVELINPGTTDLHFYLSQTKDAMPKADGIILKPTEQGIYTAAQLGNTDYAHIMVYNPHKVEAGQYEAYI